MNSQHNDAIQVMRWIQLMKIINNITEKLSDDLHVEISPHSKVSIAAACFSVYAYEELKEQLEQVDSLRFIFTSPTFLSEPSAKEKREFYIPRQAREKTLHGSEFEIRLRNEFTQKTISKECADWVRRKAQFKSNCTDETMPGFLAVDSEHPVAYAPINGFTRADLGCERGGNMFSMIQQLDAPESKAYLQLFDQLWADKRRMQDVTEQVLERITTAYQENSPEFLYFFALYNIFNDFLENLSEDDLPNEANGFKDSLGQFTRNYTQTVKRAADNKRLYAPGDGSIPPVLLSGVSKGVPPLAHDFACKV